MTVSSSLGKRKARNDEAAAPNECMFEVRVVVENHWVAETVTLPSSDATTVQQLFTALQKLVPVSRRPSLLGQPFAAPKFLVQETSVKSQGLRQSKYVMVRWDSDMSYNFWYDRNVLQGNANTLKIEVHLRKFGCAEREARAGMETAKFTWYDNRYVPYKPEVVPRADHQWVISRFDKDEFDMEDVAAIADATSTAEWFPERVVKENEEVKEPAAAEESPKQAKEEVGAQLKAEESSNVKDEDAEEDLFIMATPEEEAELEAERLRDPEAFDKKDLLDIDFEL